MSINTNVTSLKIEDLESEIARLNAIIEIQVHDEQENTQFRIEITRLKAIVLELIEQLVFYEGDEQIGVSADIMKRAREAIGQRAEEDKA